MAKKKTTSIRWKLRNNAKKYTNTKESAAAVYNAIQSGKLKHSKAALDKIK